MGWSCSEEADKSLCRLLETIQSEDHNGPANVWEYKGNRYMYELSCREHNGGAITGTVWKYIGEDLVSPAGNFRIEGNGEITRFPGTSYKDRQWASERPMFEIIN